MSVFIQQNDEASIQQGKEEAWCKFCSVALRAHKSDLMRHSLTVKHKQNAEKRKSKQLRSFGENNF